MIGSPRRQFKSLAASGASAVLYVVERALHSVPVENASFANGEDSVS